MLVAGETAAPLAVETCSVDITLVSFPASVDGGSSKMFFVIQVRGAVGRVQSFPC